MAAIVNNEEARAHHEALAKFVMNHRGLAAPALEAALGAYNIGKPGWDKFKALVLSRSEEGGISLPSAAYLLVPLDHKLITESGIYVTKTALGSHAHACVHNFDEGSVRIYQEHYERQDFPWHDVINAHQKPTWDDFKIFMSNQDEDEITLPSEAYLWISSENSYASLLPQCNGTEYLNSCMFFAGDEGKVRLMKEVYERNSFPWFLFMQHKKPSFAEFCEKFIEVGGEGVSLPSASYLLVDNEHSLKSLLPSSGGLEYCTTPYYYNGDAGAGRLFEVTYNLPNFPWLEVMSM
jgi:hypothetical protein